MISVGKANKLLWFLPLIILGSLVYSNTLQVPFYLDDTQNILENPAIRLTEITFSDIIKAGTESPLKNRPISYISFAFNYFFSQYEVKGYHLVNIFIHILTSIFLFCLFRFTLALTTINNKANISKWVAFFAALLWLVHPIQTQSVTYIVQRMNSQATMFYVLSVLLYCYGRSTRKIIFKIASFAGCLFSWLLALSSKEIAATLPFFLMLYEWFFFQNTSVEWLKKQRIVIVSSLAILILIAFHFLGTDPINYVLEGYKYRDFDLPQRVMTQFRIVWIYLGLFLLPLPKRLSLEHDIAISQGLLNPPTTAISLIAIIVLVISAVLLVRKNPFFSFAVFWLLGNLFIESSIISLELFFEHRMYLPSMFLCLFLVILCFRYLKKGVAVTLMICVVLVSSVLAYERNATWSDPAIFYKSIIDNRPGNWRAQHAYGVHMYRAAKYDEAVHHLKKSIELEPRNLFSYIVLGQALTMKEEYDAALRQFEIVREFMPYSSAVYRDLGHIYYKKGENEKALLNYDKAISLDPQNVTVYLKAGYLYASQGNFQTAIALFQKLLSISGERSFEIVNNLGVFYAEIGEYNKAILYFKEALLIEPSNQELQMNIELAKQKLQQSN